MPPKTLGSEAENKHWLGKNKIDIIVDQMVAQLVMNKPTDVFDFMKNSLDEIKPNVMKSDSSKNLPEGQGDIAVIGLAVMGMNLILNMNDHGYTVVAYNRTVQKVDDFMAGEAKGTKIIGAHSIEEMFTNLKKPRRVMLLVRAGSAVDDFINQLLPYMEAGDIIIDGGNSHFPDSIRRTKLMENMGFRYIGAGVSGGEEGARHGPSIMPGGSSEAWPHVKDIFQSISAKTTAGEACCDWVGPDGSGHYVKMVHNGIEYGDMQLICEAYHMMLTLGYGSNEIGKIFEKWNETELDSYLIEITYKILQYNDADGVPLVEKIKDTAGQKGTGKWTAVESLDLGIPLTLIGEAVFSRCLSALKDARVEASKVYSAPAFTPPANREELVENIRLAMYGSKIMSYAQGFMLLTEASKEHKWGQLNYGGVALMWRGGCIIRSKFLGKIKEAYDKNPTLSNLLLDDFFIGEVKKALPSWRTCVATGVQMGVPLPAFSTALAFFDGWRSERLPANLLQAQRDFFGAHTYELLSKPGEFVHTNWTGTGGQVSSSTYNA